jgi:hypothetical protein
VLPRYFKLELETILEFNSIGNCVAVAAVWAGNPHARPNVPAWSPALVDSGSANDG